MLEKPWILSYFSKISTITWITFRPGYFFSIWLLSRCSVPLAHMDRFLFLEKFEILSKIVWFFEHGDNQFGLTDSSDLSWSNILIRTKIGSRGAISGDVVYIDVKFCADSESATRFFVRCFVFALCWKKGTIAIISRQKSPFLVDFWYKISALRKGIEVGQDTIAPRERSYNFTSEHVWPGFENDRLHGFVGANVGKNRPTWPFLGPFRVTENAITR